MELSWGKCTIKIGKLQSSGEAPSSWIDIPTPVENSTKLTPTKGAKKEAKIEGGENEAVKYAANTYTFEFEHFSSHAQWCWKVPPNKSVWSLRKYVRAASGLL